MIKCPVNRGRFSLLLLNLPRFKGHLITNTPQSMRLLIRNLSNIAHQKNATSNKSLDLIFCHFPFSKGGDCHTHSNKSLFA